MDVLKDASDDEDFHEPGATEVTAEDLTEEGTRDTDVENDDDEDVPLVDSNLITVSESAMHKITNLVSKTTISSRGVSDVEDADLVAEHVVTNFNDHIQDSAGAKKAKLQIKFGNNLKNLGHDPLYKAKNQKEDEDRHYSDVEVVYKINGKQVPGDIIAFDNAYLDLTMKVDKNGNDANNCLSTWVSVYFAQESLKNFSDFVKAGTGYTLDVQDFTFDKTQKLFSISANMDDDEGVMFRAFQKEVDMKNVPTGKFTIAPMGTIQEVGQDEDHRAIYQGTLFFGLGASVYAPIGADPDPDVHTLNIKFELVGTRIYGRVDDVKVVTLGKKRRKKF